MENAGMEDTNPVGGDLKEKVFLYFPGFRTFAWENAPMPI
jgi:hypothetical protein